MITTLTETDARVCDDSRHVDMDMRLLGCEGPPRVEQAAYAIQTKRGDRYSVCAGCARRIVRAERATGNPEYDQVPALLDTTRELKKYATNMCATYRIWDLEKGPKYCYLDLAPDSVTMEGWIMCPSGRA